MSWLSRSPGPRPPMIQLTRLNNARLALNSDLIKYVEEGAGHRHHLAQRREAGGARNHRSGDRACPGVSPCHRERRQRLPLAPAAATSLTYPHCFANAPPKRSGARPWIRAASPGWPSGSVASSSVCCWKAARSRSPATHRGDDRLRRRLGAVMLQFPLPVVGTAFRRLITVFSRAQA